MTRHFLLYKGLERHLPWRISCALVALFILLPIVAVAYIAFAPSGGVFEHLMATVMPRYVANSLWLVLGSIVCSAALGLPSAWLVSMCVFPSVKILRWVLVLPLAMLPYVAAYIYTDWFDVSGPVQVFFRFITGWQVGEYSFPNIRSLGGAIVILSLVLYPYVYLLCSSAFAEQNITLLYAAQLLKSSPWRIFYSICLPAARPALAVGVSLVAMEAIGDFGTVNYFAVHTLTTAVYDAWLGMSSLSTAGKISLIMLFFIFVMVGVERYSRRRQKLFQNTFSSAHSFKYHLVGWKKWLAFSWCWAVVGAGFILPFAQLLVYAFKYAFKHSSVDFFGYILNSLYIAFFAAFIAILVALLLNFTYRLKSNRSTLGLMRLSGLGYSIAGTVLAIGILASLTPLDRLLNNILLHFKMAPIGLVFSGSVFAVIFAMVVRFCVIPIGALESKMAKIMPSLDMASKLMGDRSIKMLWRVHLPLLRRPMLVAGLLVFIESIKELNATLLLRPFNFETLATHVYSYVTDEQLHLAATSAVLLILLGLAALFLVHSSLEKR